MQFYQYTRNWIGGEIFEGQMLALWGIALIVMAGLFWKFGFSPTTRALIAPFLVVGLLSGGAGIYSVLNNKQRLETFQQQYNQDPAAFVVKEEQRVASFSRWYIYLLRTWSALILIGVAISYS